MNINQFVLSFTKQSSSGKKERTSQRLKKSKPCFSLFTLRFLRLSLGAWTFVTKADASTVSVHTCTVQYSFVDGSPGDLLLIRSLAVCPTSTHD